MNLLSGFESSYKSISHTCLPGIPPTSPAMTQVSNLLGLLLRKLFPNTLIFREKPNEGVALGSGDVVS